MDTPVLNAFVHPVKQAGVRRSSNHVFVTTGLLRKMLGQDPARLHEGVVRLVGVLAHELAHPLDNVDGEGILANHGRQAGGQARETRADSEGAMIAKEAGYPVESVYESLKRLFAGKRGRGGLVASLAGTHPHDDLRLAAQRLLLTLDRYEKGTSTPKYPGEVSAALLNELARVDKGAALGAFVGLKDLADALDRLNKLAGAKSGDARKTLEFNRVLLALDAMLMRRDAPLSDEDFRLFTEISLAVGKPGAPDVLDREGMERVFTAQSHSAEFLAYPAHAAFMKKIAAYNSPRYQAWIAENFFVRKEKGYGNVERALHALAKQVFAASYYESRQELYREAYRRRMAQALAREAPAGIALERLAALHQEALRDLLGASRVSADLFGAQAELLDSAPLSEPDKRALLKAVFLEGYSEARSVSGLTYNSAGAWLESDGKRSKIVLRVLVNNGLVSGALDLFSQLMGREDFRARQRCCAARAPPSRSRAISGSEGTSCASSNAGA